MPISFLTTALLIVSVITNLTVEGIKKLLDGTRVKYSSNVLAAVLSALIACAVSAVSYTHLEAERAYRSEDQESKFQ